MSESKTIKAGKCELTLTPGGTLKWIDTQGIERRIDHDPRLATRLFEAIRDGSGKPTTMTLVEGSAPARNLYENGKPVRQGSAR